ncbi:hypothetical protein [Moorena producens]|uniref:hypothetical protein n=1 Tax=Moorena producens TaxID=1155739 RepID=UPI003C72E058
MNKVIALRLGLYILIGSVYKTALNPDSRLPTPDSLLPTPYSLLPTPYNSIE